MEAKKPKTKANPARKLKFWSSDTIAEIIAIIRFGITMTRHGTQQNPNTRPPIALIAANIKTALMPLPQVHAIAPAADLMILARLVWGRHLDATGTHKSVAALSGWCAHANGEEPSGGMLI